MEYKQTVLHHKIAILTQPIDIYQILMVDA